MSNRNAGRKRLTFGSSSASYVKLMSVVANFAAALPVPVFPAGADAHWETESRVVWNEQRHTSEERELVYEISWIAELGSWRRFLRFQRRVQS